MEKNKNSWEFNCSGKKSENGQKIIVFQKIFNMVAVELSEVSFRFQVERRWQKCFSSLGSGVLRFQCKDWKSSKNGILETDNSTPYSWKSLLSTSFDSESKIHSRLQNSAQRYFKNFKNNKFWHVLIAMPFNSQNFYFSPPFQTVLAVEIIFINTYFISTKREVESHNNLLSGGSRKNAPISSQTSLAKKKP